MGELQGGQKVRVLLAQALFGSPPALLLDEPTNHLDLDSVHWLQDYLMRIRRRADRDFARPPFSEQRLHAHRRHRLPNRDHVQRRLRRHGARQNFDPLAHRTENAQREKKIAQLNEFIARFSAGTRSAQATSRKKEVERLQTAELARSNIARPYIRFQMDQHSGRHPLEIKSVAKSYDGVKVIQPFSANVDARRKNRAHGPQRRGQNHAAEIADPQRDRDTSTIPKSNFPIDGGTVAWGHNAPSAISRRITADTIVKGTTVIEWLHQFNPQASQEELRGLLGQMLFSGEDALKPTKALSGGESARMIFCRLMLQKPNMLVLDEPTNHLDLESINALNIALQKY